MGTPMPSRPPFGETAPSPALCELVAGEIWTIRKDGEDWPVVICDEPIVWTFFKDRLRPYSARKADGSWPELYKSGGVRVGHRSYPTVILGQLRFTWVTPKILLDRFDVGIGEAIRDSTKTPLLVQGCREAIRLYAMVDPLPELKKAIHKHRLERGHSNVPIGIDDTANIKRKVRGFSGNLCSIEEVDDEELPCGSQQESITSHQIKTEPLESRFFADINVFEGSTDLTASDPEQSYKKSRLDIGGRSSMRPSTPRRAPTQSIDWDQMSMIRGTPALDTTPANPGPNTVTIYVDNPFVRFRLARSSLAASPLLSRMEVYDRDDGYSVMAPYLTRTDYRDFLPVGQYLERGEYDPNILDEGTEWVRLVTNVSGQDAGDEVLRCATIYDLASKLEIAGLQDLVLRKLKALAKNEPHQPSAILSTVNICFKSAESNMRQYLVEYLAEHFWSFVMAENRLLVVTLKCDDGLWPMVSPLLTGPLETGIKAEMKTKIVKEEQLFDDAKRESESQDTVKGKLESLFEAQNEPESQHEPKGKLESLFEAQNEPESQDILENKIRNLLEAPRSTSPHNSPYRATVASAMDEEAD